MPISFLLNYSLPVVGVELILVWLAVRLFLEPIFMPRVFYKSFPTMSITDQRSLTNHVVSFVLKLICFVGAYSVMETFVFSKPLSTPIKSKSDLHRVTNGDILAFCYLTVPTIYLFELMYRTRISIVSAVHHIAAITINVLGLVIVISEHQTTFLAETEFKLIVIYGIFEMAFEVFPHLSILLYRLLRDRSHFLRMLFLSTAILIFTGTFLEQFAVGIFYAHVWKRIPLAYKVIGPILHVCFMSAQLHGGRICLQLSAKMKKEVMEKRAKAGIEGGNEAGRTEGAVMLEVNERSPRDLESGLSTPLFPRSPRSSTTPTNPSIPARPTSTQLPIPAPPPLLFSKIEGDSMETLYGTKETDTSKHP